LYDINNLNNSYLTRASKFPVFQVILDDSNEYASPIGEAQNSVCCTASASTAARAATDFTPICPENGSKLQNQEKDHFPGRRVSSNW
jgi:hypothetical protein